MEKDNYFLQMLDFVLSREGGYVNNPNDKGGETNKGITHTTYDSYRKSKGLPIQSVKYITDYEVADIYYNEFYRASGADKLDNPQLAMYVFDTAVNMGVSTAKVLLNRSNGDVAKYEKLRREKYQEYVDYDKSQGIFLKGWNNRVNQLKNYAEQNFPDTKNAAFNIGIEMNVDQYGNVIDYYNFEDLKNMDLQTLKYNFEQILRQIINKILHPTNKYYNGNQNSCSGSYPVSSYIREDGTKVEGYTRTCYKHSGIGINRELPEKFKGKKFQDLSPDELQEAIKFFI